MQLTMLHKRYVNLLFLPWSTRQRRPNARRLPIPTREAKFPFLRDERRFVSNFNGYAQKGKLNRTTTRE